MADRPQVPSGHDGDVAHPHPLSPRNRLRKMDRRTREYQYLKRTEAALFSQLGGRERASPTQVILIERLASDLLRLRIYDDRILAGEEPSIHAGRIIGALRNAVTRGLKEVGLRPFEPQAPAATLADVMADIDRERAEEPTS